MKFSKKFIQEKKAKKNSSRINFKYANFCSDLESIYGSILSHFNRRYFSTRIGPKNTAYIYLFLNIKVRPLRNAALNRDLARFIANKQQLENIQRIFRKSLENACKPLKKVISCSVCVSEKRTRQYQGIRYSVRPEMEFGKTKQSILGKLDVR